jgi:hypothetical protein
VLAEVRLPSRSAFDPFNNGGEIRHFRSQPVVINVLPVPAGFHGDYWLPADRVELREQWPADLGGLVAGEPITRSITLMADGLTSAQLPEIQMGAIDGIKQYPDQPVLKDSPGSRGISAQRVQKVALIPGAAGVYQVPEISVNWWNRATGKMETASLPARELVVAAGADNGAATETPPAPQLAPAPATTVATAGTGSRFWPWLSLLLACGWALSMAYWWWSHTRAGGSSAAIDAAVPALSRAHRDLQQTCRDNDAAATRTALLDWGRALLAPRPIANLRELCDRLGDDFRLEVDALNQSLYAGHEHSWQGASLWALCQQLEKQARADSGETRSELLPLNP